MGTESFQEEKESGEFYYQATSGIEAMGLVKESNKETTLQINDDATLLKESSLLKSNNYEAATVIDTNPKTYTWEHCSDIFTDKLDSFIHHNTVDFQKEGIKETTVKIEDDDATLLKETRLLSSNNYEVKLSTDHKEHETTMNTNPKTYTCENCSEVFTGKVDLLLHHKTIHLRIYAYTCNLCKRSFPRIGNLVAHKKVIHKQKNPYSCIICNKSFRLKRLLTSHNMKVHGQTKCYACDICNKTYRLNVNLTNHQIKAHITKEADSSVDTQIGRKKRTGSETFSCKICKKSFNSIRGLSTHEKAHIRQHPFSCKFCNKNFRLKKRLKVHHQISPDCLEARERTFNPSEIGNTAQETKLSGDENYQCDKCRKCFTCKNSIILHLQKVHNPNNPHIWKRFNKSYHPKSKLDRHVKKIHSQVKFKSGLECPDQEMKTTCSDDIHLITDKDTKLCETNSHEPDNTRQKVETLLSCKMSNIRQDQTVGSNCKICKKFSRLKKKLQCHIKLVHNQVSRYHYQSQSKKRTLNSYDIDNTAQESIINGEENYQCDKCKECLSFKSSLILHLQKAHNPNYPFISKISNELYCSKSKLDRHVTKFHHQASLECPNLGENIIENYYHQCDNFQHKLENTLASNTNKELKSSIAPLSIDSKFPQQNNFEVDSSSGTVDKLVNSGVRSTRIDSKMHQLNYHPCKSCNLSFHQRQKLLDHERAKHNRNLKYPYLCNICQKQFRLRVKLNHHMKAFHREVKRKFLKTSKSEFSSKVKIMQSLRA